MHKNSKAFLIETPCVNIYSSIFLKLVKICRLFLKAVTVLQEYKKISVIQAPSHLIHSSSNTPKNKGVSTKTAQRGSTRLKTKAFLAPVVQRYNGHGWPMDNESSYYNSVSAVFYSESMICLNEEFTWPSAKAPLPLDTVAMSDKGFYMCHDTCVSDFFGTISQL